MVAAHRGFVFVVECINGDFQKKKRGLLALTSARGVKLIELCLKTAYISS